MNNTELLPINQIKSLIKNTDNICVSIYLPIIKLGREERQNQIRLQKLLKTSEAELINNGYSPKYARDLLQPVQQIDKYEFWQQPNDGLAIFISPSQFCYYCLPLNFPELVVVANRFYLKPLLPIVII